MTKKSYRNYLKLILVVLCSVTIIAGVKCNSAGHTTSTSWEHYVEFNSTGLIQYEADEITEKIKQEDF